ncbi:MAG TPA: ABC transporter ATP-binding protein [Gemmatimonadaceae bacterium]|nr:ABC transporter ATP-binding protein [Gemmatimonadaceae bacterium]
MAVARPLAPATPPPAPPLLAVHGLTKRYGDLAALSAADFSLRDGEILGLIGPNGSGKTTLFQCVAGTMPATSGTVAVRGQAIAPEARKDVLFYVPDGIAPWPDQTVAWSIDFVRRLGGVAAVRRDEVVAALGLEPLLGARMRTLSKGEHRRAVLALGLLARQPVLMLDEPFDGLDLRQTREVMAVLRRHVSVDGRTLLLSVHQLGDAARICDRLVLLSGGRVVAEGTLAELRALAGHGDDDASDAEALEEVFLALT